MIEMTPNEKEIQKIKNDYWELYLGYDAYGNISENEEEKLDIWEWFEEKLRNLLSETK
jgi:hypothetical protein